MSTATLTNFKSFRNTLSPQQLRNVKEIAKKHNSKFAGNISTKGVKKLGQKEFLRLFVEELKYQDPMNPMNDKEFIAQMATFSTLEQMNSMGKSIKDMGKEFSGQTAVSLIGKYVEAIKDKQLVKGVVAKVTFEKGNQFIWLKGNAAKGTIQKAVQIKDIIQVREPQSTRLMKNIKKKINHKLTVPQYRNNQINGGN